MIRTPIVISLILLFTATIASAGSKSEGVIGFVTGRRAEPTKSVIVTEKLLVGKDTSGLRKKLSSSDAGEKCLAVIICEILDRKKIICLTPAEKELIRKAYSSQSIVTLMSGCTERIAVTLDNILNNTIDKPAWSRFGESLEARYEKKIDDVWKPSASGKIDSDRDSTNTEN